MHVRDTIKAVLYASGFRKFILRVDGRWITVVVGFIHAKLDSQAAAVDVAKVWWCTGAPAVTPTTLYIHLHYSLDTASSDIMQYDRAVEILLVSYA